MGLIVGLSPLPPPGTGFLSQHCRTPGWEPQACPSAARGPGSARPLPDPSGLRPQPLAIAAGVQRPPGGGLDGPGRPWSRLWGWMGHQLGLSGQHQGPALGGATNQESP